MTELKMFHPTMLVSNRRCDDCGVVIVAHKMEHVAYVATVIGFHRGSMTARAEFNCAVCEERNCYLCQIRYPHARLSVPAT